MTVITRQGVGSAGKEREQEDTRALGYRYVPEEKRSDTKLREEKSGVCRRQVEGRARVVR